jgi:tRNA threonylcarbamoyladenosine biosynthesis protein TsaE
MPILEENELDVVSHSPDQTQRFGERLGTFLEAGDVVCLQGDLGAGKTCIAQGIGRGIGVTDPITSPTFTLVSEYRAPVRGLVLYHVDVYRLSNPVEETLSSGLDEYFEGNGVCLIEWADRVEAALPRDRLWIRLRHMGASKRGLTISASGQRYEALLDEFRHSAFGV